VQIYPPPAGRGIDFSSKLTYNSIKKVVIMAKYRIGIIGAAGRMGQNLLKAVYKNPSAELSAAIDIKESPFFGSDTGKITGEGESGIKISDNLNEYINNTDAIIDFSSPESTIKHLQIAEKNNINYVIGTTGFNEKQEDLIQKTSQNITIVKASNYSMGINILSELIKQTAHACKDKFDIEIVESHHNKKKDAPSGTALTLAASAAEGAGIDFKKNITTGREGRIGERDKNEIGVFAVRAGGIIGQHSVSFASEEEIIELKHTALDRVVFAAGAVNAGIWTCSASKGFYNMRDVLGLN